MTVPRASVKALAEKLLAYGDENCEVPELSQEECLELDMLVFECCSCNHWFPQHENASRNASKWQCKECYVGEPLDE